MSALSVRARRFLFATSSVALPFVIMSAYLVLSRRWPERWFIEKGDYLALGVAIAAGMGCAWLIPARWYWRLVVSVAIGVVVGAAMLPYAVSFVCGVFGNCL